MTSTPGERYLKKYREGGKITLKQAVIAHCYDCMAGYADGKLNCEIKDCSLFPWMPYKRISKESLQNTEKKKVSRT